jgi:hypothetical protein
MTDLVVRKMAFQFDASGVQGAAHQVMSSALHRELAYRVRNGRTKSSPPVFHAVPTAHLLRMLWDWRCRRRLITNRLTSPCSLGPRPGRANMSAAPI